MTSPPLIGITTDILEPTPGSLRAACPLTYARAVAAAGGLPLFLSADDSLIPDLLLSLDGFVLTGGDDPRTEPFGEPTHPLANPMHPQRQAYETALITALLADPAIPVLGICLGMQLMALVAGGRLDQHLPDKHPDADRHRGDRTHAIVPIAPSWLNPGLVTSHHRQAACDPGRLTIAARSDDGIIEAVHDSKAAFRLGVQWHPERTRDPELGAAIFERFITSCRERRARRAPTA